MNIFVVFLIFLVLIIGSNGIDQNPKDDGEYGDYFEGDIILPEKPKLMARNAVVFADQWPNKTLYYQMSKNFTKKQRKTIKKAMNIIQSISCIKFKRRRKEKGYVQFMRPSQGCSSDVGYQNDKQFIALGDKCFHNKGGTVVHEILHALGFTHMHASFDRDDYVTINYDNIIPQKSGNFLKRMDTSHLRHDIKYDYESIMHYHKMAFTVNEKPTILPNDPKYEDKIGQREYLSQMDMQKLNVMYDCENENIPKRKYISKKESSESSESRE